MRKRTSRKSTFGGDWWPPWPVGGLTFSRALGCWVLGNCLPRGDCKQLAPKLRAGAHFLRLFSCAPAKGGGSWQLAPHRAQSVWLCPSAGSAQGNHWTERRTPRPSKTHGVSKKYSMTKQKRFTSNEKCNISVTLRTCTDSWLEPQADGVDVTHLTANTQEATGRGTRAFF